MSWSKITGYFGLLSLVVILIFTFFVINFKRPQLLSPIINQSKIPVADNVWFPKVLGANFTEIPNLTSEAAFFIDTGSGDVLYEKNSKQRLPIASLTKIMTVAVALESRDFSDRMYISEKAAGMEPDSMLLKSGETLTLDELLAGVFLVSGNDAAEAIAENTVLRREEFIGLMNSKAAQLGMKDTEYINPTGLEEGGGTRHNMSTAYDLAILSRYVIRKWPHLLEISSSPHIFIAETETHQSYELYTGINLVTTMPGVIGFKTGYTPAAGLTLVTVARRGEKEVLGVLLNAQNRRDDARALIEYSFEKLGV